MAEYKLVTGSKLELVDRLRRCGTKGEAALRPYEQADITLEHVEIASLLPLSKYVLTEQLEFVSTLQQSLQNAGLDIYELRSGIMWPDGRDGRALAAPIVEFWPGEGLLLVDGIHRIWSAREQGRTEVICAVVRKVTVPLVPFPVLWEDVKVFPLGQQPTEEEKRAYRFPDTASLRAAVPGIANKVTDDNFRYFLFRNLDELGSSGIRAVSN